MAWCDVVCPVQAAVAKALLKLNCIPVFLSEKLTHQCYYRYCKGVLWPVRVSHSLVILLRIGYILQYLSNLRCCLGRLNNGCFLSSMRSTFPSQFSSVALVGGCFGFLAAHSHGLLFLCLTRPWCSLSCCSVNPSLLYKMFLR